MKKRPGTFALASGSKHPIFLEPEEGIHVKMSHASTDPLHLTLFKTLTGKRPNAKELKTFRRLIQKLGVTLTDEDATSLRDSVLNAQWRLGLTSPDKLEFLENLATGVMDMQIPAWDDETETWAEEGVCPYVPERDDTLENLREQTFFFEERLQRFDDVIRLEHKSVVACAMVDEIFLQASPAIRSAEDKIHLDTLVELVFLILDHSDSTTHKDPWFWIDETTARQPITSFVRTHASRRNAHPDEFSLSEWIEQSEAVHALKDQIHIFHQGPQARDTNLTIDRFETIYESEEDEDEDNPTLLIMQSQIAFDKSGTPKGKSPEHTRFLQRALSGTLQEGLMTGGMLRVQRNAPIAQMAGGKPIVEAYCAAMGPQHDSDAGVVWLNAQESKKICTHDPDAVHVLYKNPPWFTTGKPTPQDT